MKNRVTVREHARLTTDELDTPSLDRAQVPSSAFDWLVELNGRLARGGAALVEVESRRWLRLDNHVGVIETPCGTLLEILPKHADVASAPESRRVLARMLSAALDLPARKTDEANLRLFDAPLDELVMRRFVEALDTVVRRGLRSDYQRVEATEHFLRGQLDVTRQLQHPPGRDHLFAIRYDVLSVDRPENRLARSALLEVCRATENPDTWRLAQELQGRLGDVPCSRDVASDFRRWQGGRLMAHYRDMKPWCELVLGNAMPQALAGDWRGVSLLFPMEKLFERTVAAALRRALPPRAHLVTQSARHSLCRHDDAPMFRLQPDLLVEHEGDAWVLDTKWKMLDATARDRNYGISQGDLYQLFAYAHHYRCGQGDLVMIYPAHAGFPQPLKPFEFIGDVRLWVVPFDLDKLTLRGNAEVALPGLV